MHPADVIFAEDATDEECGRALAALVGRDVEIGRLVARYVDARNEGVPMTITEAVRGASSAEVGEEAAELMNVADLLFVAGGVRGGIEGKAQGTRHGPLG